MEEKMRKKMQDIDPKEGRIFREGNRVIVEMIGASHLSSLVGVECLNPDDSEEKRIYRKTFTRRKIYLPGEYDQAVAENLSGTDVLIIGINGYSVLTPEQCLAWGVKEGAYEAASEAILIKTIKSLANKITGITVRIVHGASEMDCNSIRGIDAVAMEVARKLNLEQLGHSCPKFMFYVRDDENKPVYVARTQAEYAMAFIESLDILIAANGRKQAYEHDIDAVFKKKKHLIPVNILKSISVTGGPPAINAQGGIEDAVAAMEYFVHMVSAQISGPEQFEALCDRLDQVVTTIARQTVSPERAFGCT
jgi:hypothetical protein